MLQYKANHEFCESASPYVIFHDLKDARRVRTKVYFFVGTISAVDAPTDEADTLVLIFDCSS
jgi:hypothetical protein